MLFVAVIALAGIGVSALLVTLESRVLRDWRRDLRPRIWGGVAALVLLPLPGIVVVHHLYVADLPTLLGPDASAAMISHHEDMAGWTAAFFVGGYLLFSLPVFFTALFRHGMWTDRNALTPLES